MGEPWLAKLKAMEDHIAAFQRSRAQTTDEAVTWTRLREELERIVPGPKGDLKIPPKVTDNLPKRAEPSWTDGEAALWNELRADLEALRLKIRAEVETRRSRTPL